MSNELKTSFIQKALVEYMLSVEEGMRLAAKRLGVGVTEEGIRSLAHKVLQSGGGAIGQLSFKEYLRFVDMGTGRGHPLGGLKAVSISLQASNKKGLALVKDNIRKPKKLYSKTVYGKLSYLQGKLLHGYTEEAIAMLKAELLNNNTN